MGGAVLARCVGRFPTTDFRFMPNPTTSRLRDQPSSTAAAAEKPSRSGRSAALVSLGILLSRLIGLVRTRVFAHYFGGTSDAADAFNAAFRIPNFLQNLFGEGALSASFIPVYANLLGQGKREEAGRVAGAIATILSLVVSAIVLVGITATPLLIGLIAPGFTGEKRELTIALVRILFPGAGLLVISAWCLGVLNSHRRFFLSYSAPVIWNVAMIAALLGWGGRVGEFELATVLAWGSVAGSALQFLVQLPLVLRLAKGLRLSLNIRDTSVAAILRNFIPAFISRGVVQISAYVDAMIASLLGTGAVTGLSYAQLLYTLPVSLFGMAISATELAEMSRTTGSEDQIHQTLRTRLNAGLRRVAFFIVPSATAFLAFGDLIAAALFQSGKFTADDSRYVWAILAGSSVGLLASTMGRLYSSTFYALRDTRSPLKYAITRVAFTTVLGVAFALYLPSLFGLQERWGIAGLTISAGFAGWVEFFLLRRQLNRRIGHSGLPASVLLRLWGAAIAAAGAGWGVKLLLPAMHPVPIAAAVLIPFGGVYAVATTTLGIAESRALLGRVWKKLR